MGDLVIQASGHRPDGEPRIMLGLTGPEVVRLLAGEMVTVESELVNPLLPPMQIMLMGGPNDEAMLGRLRAAYPGIWEVPDA